MRKLQALKIALLIVILAEEIKRANRDEYLILEKRVKKLESKTANYEIASYNLKNLTNAYIKKGFSKSS